MAFLQTRTGIGIMGVVAAAALAFGAFHSGYRSGMDRAEERHRASLVEHIQRAQAQATEIALQDAEIAMETVRIQRRIDTIYRDREIEVIRHVQADPATGCESLTRFGHRLLDHALTRGNPAPARPGQPDDSMPRLGSDSLPGRADDPMRGRPGIEMPRSEMPGGNTGPRFGPILLVPSPTLGPI